MSNGSDKHVKLILRTLPSGQHAVVTVQESTADFLGWTLHFQTYDQWVRDEIAAGSRVARFSRRCEPRAKGGVPLRIGRGTNKRRNEAGLTHTFRIGSKVSIRDLAELASFTEVDWHWMERPCGSRMSREWWWDRYTAIP